MKQLNTLAYTILLIAKFPLFTLLKDYNPDEQAYKHCLISYLALAACICIIIQQPYTI